MFLGTVLVTTLSERYNTKDTEFNKNDPQYKFQKSLTFLKEENERIEAELSDLKDKILQQEQSLLLQEEVSNSLIFLRDKLWVSELSGAGVLINLNDNPRTNRQELSPDDDSLIHASDIRDIINLLNIANAKGISINNYRATFNSAISCVGNSILVGNKHVVPPIQIKAIGNSALIKSYLQNEKLLENLYSRIEKNNLTFKVAEKTTITLPSFNYDYIAEYMNPVNWFDTSSQKPTEWFSEISEN